MLEIRGPLDGPASPHGLAQVGSVLRAGYRVGAGFLLGLASLVRQAGVESGPVDGLAFRAIAAKAVCLESAHGAERRASVPTMVQVGLAGGPASARVEFLAGAGYLLGLGRAVRADGLDGAELARAEIRDGLAGVGRLRGLGRQDSLGGPVSVPTAVYQDNLGGLVGAELESQALVDGLAEVAGLGYRLGLGLAASLRGAEYRLGPDKWDQPGMLLLDRQVLKSPDRLELSP